MPTIEIKNRIYSLRKTLNISQEAFGKKIGVTRSAVSNYESGGRKLTDQTLLLICREFNINEEWLRFGEGEIFIKSYDDDFGEIQKKYNLDDIDVKIVKEYFLLPVESRKIFKSFFMNVFGKGNSTLTSDEEIEIEVENYRKQLEEERKFPTYSASNVGCSKKRTKIG